MIMKEKAKNTTLSEQFQNLEKKTIKNTALSEQFQNSIEKMVERGTTDILNIQTDVLIRNKSKQYCLYEYIYCFNVSML